MRYTRYMAYISDFFKTFFTSPHAALALFAVALTYLCVVSGLDWQYNYFANTEVNIRTNWLSLADMLGFVLLPIFALGTYGYAYFTKNSVARILARAALLSLIAGLILSTSIKIVTGRESPPHFHTIDRLATAATWVDNSNNFQFGFLREQIFGGYPSSHATIYFAFAFLTHHLYIREKKKVLKYLSLAAILAALYISIGVSLGHHWLSEVLAGAVLGCIVGRSLRPIL
jgi:membrane-associated phospholipid phosphatase